MAGEGDGREGDGHERGCHSSILRSAHLSVPCAVVSAFASSSMIIVLPPLLNVLGSMPCCLRPRPHANALGIFVLSRGCAAFTRRQNPLVMGSRTTGSNTTLASHWGIK